ncbi:phosphoenolpyruvate mutase [Candidatus Marinimicrobia bacterium]|nr:phosphoenolpyruvate mutase [Candidatus Neomarinimicrobiota bacterium]
MNKVYIAMSADFIHHGHMNIIEKARSLGSVTVGLLTDKAIAEHKRLPYLDYKQREKIISNIKGVEKIIPQNTRDYTENLKLIKPDFVVHGDDWKKGFRKKIRTQVVNLLKDWGGKLIEIPYTKDTSSTDMQDYIRKIGITPDIRRSQLRRLIDSKNIIRIIEAHNGLTGLVAENIKFEDEKSLREFDGMWASSLTDSTSRGKPDIEAVDLTSRLTNINDLMEVTTKPIIYDGDTGGKIEHFSFTVKTLERLGVSAIIIEDKVGLKKNSLLGTDVKQTQDSIQNFCEKIKAGKKAKITNDFMIIARIESLVLNKGIKNAIDRASAYIHAGADGIMIHSKEKEFTEIKRFLEQYNNFVEKVPIVVVPSTYSHIKEKELSFYGVNIVIYANQLLRSAYPAMKNTAELILKHQRALEADEKNCMPIKEILTLVPGTK